MDTSNQQQLSEDVPAAPGFGLKGKPTFGLSREKSNRLELVLALKGGGLMNVFVEIDDEATSERVESYANELAAAIGAGERRSFVDSWTATGQRAWIDMGQVVAFTVRQAK
jgi:hypothetical protein